MGNGLLRVEVSSSTTLLGIPESACQGSQYADVKDFDYRMNYGTLGTGSANS